MVSDINKLEQISTHSNFTCPDCGGGLWKIKNERAMRFRCHTGHVYTANTLLEKQSEKLEESVWVSIRMLEERRNLLLQLANRVAAQQMTGYQQAQIKRADELSVHINCLKEMLVSLSKRHSTDEGYL